MPVTILQKGDSLMFTCILEIEGGKVYKESVFRSHVDKEVCSASFVPGSCRHKHE